MNKKEFKSLVIKYKEIYKKDSKRINKFIIIILSFNIFNAIVKKIEKEKRNAIWDTHRDRDDIRIAYLEKFMEKSLKPTGKHVGGLSTYKTSDYYFNVKNISDLEIYFNDITKDSKGISYRDFLKTSRKHNACGEHEDIFKVKKTADNGVPDVKIYVALCIEDEMNHAYISKNDWGFFNNYYEFMIGDWTKEEVLNGKIVEEVDFTNEAYENLGDLLPEENNLDPYFRDRQKEDFLYNFRKKYDEKTFIHNKSGSHYLFFVNSSEDLKKYFYRYSGISENRVFSDFIKEVDESRCGENETIFKYKKKGKYHIIYIALCLEDDEGGSDDGGFFDGYEEFTNGDWTKEEIIKGLNMDKSYSE